MKDSKVALVNPGKKFELGISEPLNLEYIAAFLEKNKIEVKIFDELAGQDALKGIKKFSPDFVGITATTPIAPRAYEVGDICKEIGIKTIMGGAHPSVLPEEALNHSDIVIVGDGERAMLDVVKGKFKSGIISSPHIKILDELPFPARHLVDMEYYLMITGNGFLHHTSINTRTGGIITSRGCPFRCVFCWNSMRKAPFRWQSAGRVISEIKQLIEEYGIEALFFFDDSLFAVKPRLHKICKLIKKERIKITWGCNSRVDQIDLKTLRLVYGAGCREISFGFESGSQRILNVLNKGTTVEQNERAIKLCKKVGIMVDGSFMIGNPSETIKDIRLTQKFISENEIDFAGICMTTPFPGSKLWELCKKNNLIPKKIDWSKFDVTEPSTPILVNTEIPEEKIKELFLETDKLVSGMKKRIRISWIIKEMFKHPKRTISIIKRSKSPLKYLFRLGI